MIKKIKIMGDYCSSGLWDYETGIMIEIEDLNINDRLKKRIQKWSYNWTSIYYSYIDIDDINKKTNKYIKYQQLNIEHKYLNELKKEQYLISKMLKQQLDIKICVFDENIFTKYKGKKPYIINI